MQNYMNSEEKKNEVNTQAELSDEKWTCECGKENTGKFCGECGKGKKTTKKCPNCGKENEENSKFCNECGTKL